MYIPNALAEEIKFYLKNLAQKGDVEAQKLLSQIEQAASSTLTTIEEIPPEEIGLQC